MRGSRSWGDERSGGERLVKRCMEGLEREGWRKGETASMLAYNYSCLKQKHMATCTCWRSDKYMIRLAAHMTCMYETLCIYICRSGESPLAGW